MDENLPDIFTSSFAKFRWAQRRGQELKPIIDEFVSKQPYRVIAEDNDDLGGKNLKLVQVEPFPHEIFALILGDAIHNFKCALDHAVFQISSHARITKKLNKIKLPTGNDRKAFESQCKGFFEESPWLEDWMKGTEIFPDGKGRYLYYLTQINNTDKHKSIPIQVQAVRQPSVEVTVPGLRPFQSYSNILIGASEYFLAHVPVGASFTCHGHENIPVDIFFWDGPMGVSSGARHGGVLDVLNLFQSEVARFCDDLATRVSDFA